MSGIEEGASMSFSCSMRMRSSERSPGFRTRALAVASVLFNLRKMTDGPRKSAANRNTIQRMELLRSIYTV